ncbi:MAG: hypothetical protein IAE67_00470 [Candidatus Competibacteraceae bacterium]|nr:hypothetical protein [Candidatus Competibacteraceae bacterium]
MRLLFLLLTILILTSCAEKQTICRFKHLLSDGSVVVSVNYNDNQIPDHIKLYNTNGILVYSIYVDFENGIPSTNRMYDYTGKIMFFFYIAYDPSGRIKSIYVHSDSNQDGYCESLVLNYILHYDNHGDPFLNYAYDNSNTLLYADTLYWQNGNVVKKVRNSGEYKLYSYDQAVNPYYPLRFLMLMQLVSDTDFSSFCANNITEILSYNSMNVLQNQESNTYLYNENGLPASRNVTYTYEYECFEE